MCVRLDARFELRSEVRRRLLLSHVSHFVSNPSCVPSRSPLSPSSLPIPGVRQRNAPSAQARLYASHSCESCRRARNVCRRQHRAGVEALLRQLREWKVGVPKGVGGWGYWRVDRDVVEGAGKSGMKERARSSSPGPSLSCPITASLRPRAARRRVARDLVSHCQLASQGPRASVNLYDALTVRGRCVELEKGHLSAVLRNPS